MTKLEFKLEDIKILRSEVRDHPIVFNEEFSFEKLSMDIESKFNYSEMFVQNFMHFEYKSEDKGKTVTLGHFDILYTFEVNELGKVLEKQEMKRLLHLNMIAVSYSTSRGIIFSETKGFAINEFYLKPISPIKLYEEMLEKGKEMKESPVHNNR